MAMTIEVIVLFIRTVYTIKAVHHISSALVYYRSEHSHFIPNITVLTVLYQ